MSCNFACAKFNMISVWPPAQCNLTQKRGTVDCGAVCCIFFSVWNMNLIPILTSIVFTLFSQGQNDRKRIVFFFSSLDAMCQIEKISNNEEDSSELLKKQSNTVWKSLQKWSHEIDRYTKTHEMRFPFILCWYIKTRVGNSGTQFITLPQDKNVTKKCTSKRMFNT